jgi:hypothetical protein
MAVLFLRLPLYYDLHLQFCYEYADRRFSLQVALASYWTNGELASRSHTSPLMANHDLSHILRYAIGRAYLKPDTPYPPSSATGTVK